MDGQGYSVHLCSHTGSYDQYDNIMFPKEVIGAEATRADTITDEAGEGAVTSQAGQVWYSRYFGAIKGRIFGGSSSAAEFHIESGQQQCIPVYLQQYRNALVCFKNTNIELITEAILHIFHQLHLPHYLYHDTTHSCPSNSISQVCI